MKLSSGFWYAFLAAVAWALSILVTRVILKEGEDSYNMVFWTAILALPYWILQVWKKRSEFAHLPGGSWLLLLVMGMLSPAGTKMTEALALQRSSAVNYAFLIRMVTPFTIFFAWFLLRERITRKQMLMVGMILVGAYLLTTNGQRISLSLGDAFILLNALLLAFGNNVLGKLATNRMPALVASSGAFLCGVVPIAILAGSNGSIGLPHSPALIILLSIIGILLTVFRFEAYHRMSVSHASIIFSSTPVLVALLAIPILGESLSFMQVVGGGIILASGLLIERWKTGRDAVPLDSPTR